MTDYRKYQEEYNPAWTEREELDWLIIKVRDEYYNVQSNNSNKENKELNEKS